MHWALAVVLGVRKGKVAQQDLEWDPSRAGTDYEWFLPKPGEWMPPMSLSAMGSTLPMRPALPEAKLHELQMRGGLVYNHEGRQARLKDVIRLWYLLVAHLQGKEGSAQRNNAVRHIRPVRVG